MSGDRVVNRASAARGWLRAHEHTVRAAIDSMER